MITLLSILIFDIAKMVTLVLPVLILGTPKIVILSPIFILHVPQIQLFFYHVGLKNKISREDSCCLPTVGLTLSNDDGQTRTVHGCRFQRFLLRVQSLENRRQGPLARPGA